MKPYYEEPGLQLYHGDVRQVLGTVDIKPDCVIADPPYGQTSCAWDKRLPAGEWLPLLPPSGLSLWCFGSLRFFMETAAEWDGWRLAEDIVWEKHNGSSFAADRFKRVHEVAARFYRGRWSDVYRAPVKVLGGTKKTIRRKERPPHMGSIERGHYTSEDGGPRLLTSVLKVRSAHGYAENETEKPVGIVAPLIESSCPPGGLLLEPFGGSGPALRYAKMTGRRAVYCDIREEQCEMAARRLSELLPLGMAG